MSVGEALIYVASSRSMVVTYAFDLAWPRPYWPFDPLALPAWSLLLLALMGLNPRQQLAVRLYATGVAATKKEAARAVGLSDWPEPSEASVEVATIQEHLDFRMLDTATLLRTLAREGLETIATTMRSTQSEAIKLKAAIDLADRGPETSKVQRHSVVSAQFSGEDLRALAEAIGVSSTIYGREVGPAELAMVTIDQGAEQNEGVVPKAKAPDYGEDAPVEGGSQ